MQAAANILGTSFGGFELALTIVGIALFIVLLILGGLVAQIIKVRRFYSRYIAYVWHPEESIHRYDEMDDPVLKRIHQCLRLKPAMRVKGEYKPMDVAMEEPARTERMLKRAEWLGMKHCCKDIVCGICCVLPGLLRTSSAKKGGAKTAAANEPVAATAAATVAALLAPGDAARFTPKSQSRAHLLGIMEAHRLHRTS